MTAGPGRYRSLRAVLATVGGLAGLAAILPAAELRAEAACSPGRVDLRWPGGRQSFVVEVADDTAERALGLMARETLSPDAGMLFVYEAPRAAQFWMKDTLIPLDMIFADAAGVVTRVHGNAVPLDLTPIDGGSDVQFVLEVNGGLAERLGIVPGAVLRHPAIGDAAAWPCK
ncbi:DUF192 domain-containing protein [Rhodobacter sp. Har01]|uniref:DUF192 domain-containing protein n=1 Tax=Rhodobacter sp. Har01 TaxID=2883999 RepID=UPI001D06736F|nr:DUF192 domain-containing protein [Rhodobacter sp. Har01]MCB6176761.1 DUF192 domain-containing protein [Rhodobacter sp. Har01]